MYFAGSGTEVQLHLGQGSDINEALKANKNRYTLIKHSTWQFLLQRLKR